MLTESKQAIYTTLSLGGLFFCLILTLRWLSVRGWKAVRASVESVEILRDSRTWRPRQEHERNNLNARYRYEYKGVSYSGMRISVVDSCTIYSLTHSSVLSRLRESKEHNKTLHAYIDTNQPWRSILDNRFPFRSVAYALAFSLFFLFMSSLGENPLTQLNANTQLPYYLFGLAAMLLFAIIKSTKTEYQIDKSVKKSSTQTLNSTHRAQ